MDGKTEVVYRSLGNFLRCLTKERGKSWDLILPQADYAYNDRLNRSIGRSPFEVVYGMIPRGVYELRDLKGMERRSAQGENFAIAMHDIHQKVKETLQKSAERYLACLENKDLACKEYFLELQKKKLFSDLVPSFVHILEGSASGSKNAKRKSVISPPRSIEKTKSEVAHEVISLDDLESSVVIKDNHVAEERKDEEDDTCSIDNIFSLLKEEVGLKKFDSIVDIMPDVLSEVLKD
ncbi:uncharacterized protein LOC131856947 [Cryptomeria japonica]|uniref:uncharacterized protein LOC131856947 n=1 Tax=Cryptomeria japonica TaxID=3369 RepID=UPI0027DA0206|nr:uncharacterized protein LOC131856947 [Cryptomeria japonica]